MRARGYGDLWGKNESLTTGGTEKHEDIAMIPFQESDGGVTFAVKVHPRAKKNAITGKVGDALKVSLTAPPIDGRANQACVEFFAKFLKVPQSSVTIAHGHSSRSKVIRVAGISAEQVRAALR